MRPTIAGVLAAILVAVVATVTPAAACGPYGSGCLPCSVGGCAPTAVYVSPAPVYDYSGCYGCGGWAYERLPDPAVQYYPDPVVQYYFVNQGPTYTGPGNFAPLPTYQESAISGWDVYRSHSYYYGYNGGRYASATTHYYDGVGLDGPAIFTYRARPRFRPSRYAYTQKRLFRPHFGSNGVTQRLYGARAQLLQR